ncbi:MAG: GNAT family N-acetyltransferase [Bacillota bacterium]
MRTPILETERLILRPLCLEDVQEVLDCWECDPDVARYMFWTSHNDINKTKQWLSFEISKINSDDWYRWGFVLKESGALIGTGLIYFEEEYNMYEIGFNLGKKAWGCGYTTEAMKKIIHFAKRELGIREIVGRHAKENQSSGNVLKKLGFKYIKDCPYECNEGKTLYEGKEYLLKL